MRGQHRGVPAPTNPSQLHADTEYIWSKMRNTVKSKWLEIRQAPEKYYPKTLHTKD